MTIRHPLRAALAAAAATALLGACASTPPYEARWTDPQLGAQSGLLRGARVLVACDAIDPTIRQLCQDRLAAEVAARGATPVFVPPETAVAGDRSVEVQLLPAARRVGAKAMLVVTIAPATKIAASPNFTSQSELSFRKPTRSRRWPTHERRYPWNCSPTASFSSFTSRARAADCASALPVAAAAAPWIFAASRITAL